MIMIGKAYFGGESKDSSNLVFHVISDAKFISILIHYVFNERFCQYHHALILCLTIGPCSCNLASNQLWRMNDV